MSGLFIIPAIIIEILGSILIIEVIRQNLLQHFEFILHYAIIFHNDFDSSSEMTAFKNIALAGGFLIIFAHGPKNIVLIKNK